MLTLERAVQILNFQKPFEKLVKQAENVVQCEIESGAAVPGWKLAERSSKRAWLSEDQIITDLENAGFTEDDYMNRSLKSPAQIEKDLKFKTEDHTIQTTSTVVVPNKSRCRETNASPESEFGNDS